MRSIRIPVSLYLVSHKAIPAMVFMRLMELALMLIKVNDRQKAVIRGLYLLHEIISVKRTAIITGDNYYGDHRLPVILAETEL
jgi:hypothetical protein